MLAHFVRGMWRYRHLLASLARREVISRYQQSLLGPAWAILQPLVLMLTFALIQSFVPIPSEGVAYPVYVYAGLLPWTTFTSTVTVAAPSIVQNGAIIKKVYFPREILPISSAIVALFDLFMGGVVLALLMAGYGVVPSVWIATLPLLILVLFAFSLGIGLLAAALGTFKRDVIFVAFFLMQIWMYASPVMYPLSAVPAKWRSLYLCNPMAGIVDSFRRVLVGLGPPDWRLLGISAAGAAVTLLVGFVVFKKLEGYYADVV